MKAVVYEKYGSPDELEVREVDEPAIGDRDVRVRVHASCVNGGDWHMLTATWFVVRLFQGLFRPKRPILGFDVAGTVEAVGREVTRFRPGDEVLGSSDKMGGFAEYTLVPESGLAPKPAGVTFEQAAAVPTAGLTALHGLRDKGRIREGHKVLINGASGGVGSFAVQIAKALGAEVTGVARGEKLDVVRSIGADHTIDYRKQDFTQGDERYDLVLDVVGNRSLKDCRGTLRAEGIYVAVSGHPARALWIALVGGKRQVAFVSSPNSEDLAVLGKLMESGKMAPVIDRRYPLSEVPEAMRYFGEGRTRGKIVINVRDAE